MSDHMGDAAVQSAGMCYEDFEVGKIPIRSGER